MILNLSGISSQESELIQHVGIHFHVSTWCGCFQFLWETLPANLFVEWKCNVILMYNKPQIMLQVGWKVEKSFDY